MIQLCLEYFFYRKAMKNVHKLLANDGQLIFIVVTHAFWMDFWRMQSINPKYSGHMTNVASHLPPINFSDEAADNYKNALEVAGFKIEDFKVVETKLSRPTFEEIRHIFKGIDPMISGLSDKLKDEYLEDFRLEMIKNKFITDKEFFNPFKVLKVRATKN